MPTGSREWCNPFSGPTSRATGTRITPIRRLLPGSGVNVIQFTLGTSISNDDLLLPKNTNHEAALARTKFDNSVNFTPNPFRRHTRGRRGHFVPNSVVESSLYTKKRTSDAIGRAKSSLAFDKHRHERAWKGKEFRAGPKSSGKEVLTGNARRARIFSEANRMRVLSSSSRQETRKERLMRRDVLGEERVPKPAKVRELVDPKFDLLPHLSRFKRGKLPSPALRAAIEACPVPAGRGAEKERLLRAMKNEPVSNSLIAIVDAFFSHGELPELSVAHVEAMPRKGVTKRQLAALVKAMLIKAGIEPNPGPSSNSKKNNQRASPASQPKADEGWNCVNVGIECACFKYVRANGDVFYRCVLCGTPCMYVRTKGGCLGRFLGIHASYKAGYHVPYYEEPRPLRARQSYLVYDGLPESYSSTSSSDSQTDCSSSSTEVLQPIPTVARTPVLIVEDTVVPIRTSDDPISGGSGSEGPFPPSSDGEGSSQTSTVPSRSPTPQEPETPAVEVENMLTPATHAIALPASPPRSFGRRVVAPAFAVANAVARLAMKACSAAAPLSRLKACAQWMLYNEPPVLRRSEGCLTGHVYDITEGKTGAWLDFSPLFASAGYYVPTWSIQSAPQIEGTFKEPQMEGDAPVLNDKRPLNLRSVKMANERYETISLTGYGMDQQSFSRAIDHVAIGVVLGVGLLGVLLYGKVGFLTNIGSALSSCYNYARSFSCPYFNAKYLLPPTLSHSQWFRVLTTMSGVNAMAVLYRSYRGLRYRPVTIKYAPHLVTCALLDYAPTVDPTRYADIELMLASISRKISCVAAFPAHADDAAKLAHDTALVTYRVLSTQNFY